MASPLTPASETWYNSPMIGYDIETKGLSPWGHGHELVSWVVATEDSIKDWHTLLDEKPKRSSDVFGHLSHPVIAGHNLVGFDALWSIKERIWPDNAEAFDTLVVDATIMGSKGRSLDECLKYWLKKEKFDPGVKPDKLWTLKPDELLEYNRSDSIQVLELAKKLKSVASDMGLMPLVKFKQDVGRVLINMMVTGVKLDTEYVARMEKELAVRTTDLERYLNEAAGKELNWNSPQQVSKLLFDDWKLPTGLINDYKSPDRSTGKNAIQALIANCGVLEVKTFLENLGEWRIKSRLSSTYLKPLIDDHLGTDGRIHTTFNLAGTVTGRLSSSKPNLQNIAKDAIVGGAFVPSNGMKFGIWDYKQLELVLAAWFAKEHTLIDAFNSGHDLHTAVLADMKGVSYDEAMERVSSGEWERDRRHIKNVHFGILYQGGPHAVVRQALMAGVKLSHNDARQMIEQWYDKYPRVHLWIQQVLEDVRKTGKVTSPTGQTRYLPEASMGVKKAERQAVNSLLQGLAAQITLAGLVAIDKEIKGAPFIRPVLTIHDSIVIEYAQNWYEDKLNDAVTKAMTKGVRDEMMYRFDFGHDLPLEVDAKMNLSRLVE